MTNPITPAMLRQDWLNHPDLDETQKILLGALADSKLQAALDAAFERTSYEDVWSNLLDEALDSATRELVEQLPNPKKARKGTKDECLKCFLPITARSGGGWEDEIMGSDVCSQGGEHSPGDVIRKIQTAIQEAGDPAPDEYQEALGQLRKGAADHASGMIGGHTLASIVDDFLEVASEKQSA